MDPILIAIGVFFAALAAVIHSGFFIVESVLWARPAIWKRFGLRSQSDADVARPMAYNQGFYNLFLAVGAGGGLVLMDVSGQLFGGIWQGTIWLVLFTLSSMLLAGIVLLSTSLRLWKAALLQGLPPLLGMAFLLPALL